MGRPKKATTPEEARFLTTKAELIALLRDPKNLAPVRRFCQILWGQTPRGKNFKDDLNSYIQLVAREVFPEWPIESERERQESREKANRDRRLRRLAVS
jgi:hypothetical protein